MKQKAKNQASPSCPAQKKTRRDHSAGSATGLKRRNPQPLPNGEFLIGISTLGIISGFVDLLVQAPFFPEFAVNNTYGIQLFNQSVAEQVQAAFVRPGGCGDLLRACQAATNAGDPENIASPLGALQELGATQNCTSDELNCPCIAASLTCLNEVFLPGTVIAESGRNTFDIGHLLPDPNPPHGLVDTFMNLEWVQKHLGAEVNYTSGAPWFQDRKHQATIPLAIRIIACSFAGILTINFTVFGSDFSRGHFLKALGPLLEQGVQVALIYGDRDYRTSCEFPPIGGTTSLVPKDRTQTGAAPVLDVGSVGLTNVLNPIQGSPARP